MGDAKALASLLQRGVDPDTVDAQGNTLLILAAREGQTAALEALLKYRVRIDYRKPAGDSALMLAVLRGHDDAARALLKAREGDEVMLMTPAGLQRLEVIEVRYPAPGEPA